MDNDYSVLVARLLKKLHTLNYIKPNVVPDMDLYMDQLTTFMDEHLSSCKRRSDDKTLTKTMINNYTKNKLLPPPDKKKYSKEHIFLLTFIYYYKNLLSISDIQKLFEPLNRKYFNNDEDINIEKIYKEIYNMSKSQIDVLTKDVIAKAKLSDTTFESIESEEDKEFLKLFSLVSLLSFDVYMKKNIIENLIDDFSEKHS